VSAFNYLGRRAVSALDDVRKYSALVRECDDDSTDARTERDEAIARARTAGAKYKDLASASGLSLAAVQRLAVGQLSSAVPGAGGT
jgi:uncharacterized protein YdbL (DUF1318 family)